MTLVFAEAAIPCLSGAAIGAVLAAVLELWPTHLLPPGLSDLPKPTLSFGVLAFSFGCALLLALAGAAIPMRRLRHLSVVDSLAGR
jgi:ABC-type antimicrobial peptide transport system permease subunit